MTDAVFSTRSRTATATFIPNLHRRVLFLLIADSTRVHPQQPVNTSVFAVPGCRPLIPEAFPQSYRKLLLQQPAGGDVSPLFRCEAASLFSGAAQSPEDDDIRSKAPPRTGISGLSALTAL